MKNKFIILFLFFAFLLFANSKQVKVNADDYSINNMADVLDWTTILGNKPTIHLNETNEADGIFLCGSGNDTIFDYKYNNKIAKNEIMVDFYVDEQEINYKNNPKISFIFSNNSSKFCEFSFDILEESFNANVNFGNYNLKYEDLLYKENSHIQFRIAKDEIMNRETGEYFNAWNLVLGIQKKTVTTKNDKYSVKVNKFDDESFSQIDSYLDSFDDMNSVDVEIKASSKGNNNIGVQISQIGTNNFYNCYVYSSDYISFSDISYTNLKMSFTLPNDNINYSGIIIKRYINGEYDKMYQYSNKYANSLTEKYLKQASDYSYEIFGLEQVSSSNRIACNKIMFRIEAKKVTTLAGNPIKLFYGIMIIISLVVLFILSYVYRFEIGNIFKKKLKGNKI